MGNSLAGKPSGFALRSLIPFEDFKTILGIDDRDDVLSRYCLITATCTIEQHCKRRLFLKRHFERIEFHGDLILPLREYPVREMLAVYVQKTRIHADFLNRSFCGAKSPTKALETQEPAARGSFVAVAEPELVEPEFYSLCPEIEEQLDIPHALRLSPVLGRLPGLTAFKAVYRAGSISGKAPADLASACLELAAWNMTRYKGRRIGMTGNVRGSGYAARGGTDGEYPEASMPENVRGLLEPYKRRVL
jgi:hypothetical protein